MRANAQLITALLCGGLGGAVFTWWVHLPAATVVTYSDTTTTIGAATTLKSLVPDVRLKIGPEDVPVLYVHAIDFVTQAGPRLDSSEVAITFPGIIRMFGYTTEAPSVLHHISCARLPNGLRCKLSPISVRRPNAYRVSIALDTGDQPVIQTAAETLQFTRLVDFQAHEQQMRYWFGLPDPFVVAPVIVLGAIALGVVFADQRKIRHLRSEIERLDQNSK